MDRLAGIVLQAIICKPLSVKDHDPCPTFNLVRGFQIINTMYKCCVNFTNMRLEKHISTHQQFPGEATLPINAFSVKY